MRMNRRLVPFSFLIASACALLIPGMSQAQSAPAPPTYLRVTLARIKPGMRTAWLDGVQARLMPALNKAGVKSVAIYQTVFGNEYEYYTVRRLQRFTLSGAQGARVRALGTKGAAEQEDSLGKYVQSVHVIVIAPQTELSNTPAGEHPPVCVFALRRVLPGKMQDYRNFVRTEVLPVYKKAGEYFEVYQRVYGANDNDFVSMACVNKFSDLAGGSLPARVLGQNGAEKLFAEWDAIAPLVSITVRHRLDMSY
ncbi:MAG TPA: hypothetical protein VNJ52_04415 [Patescibacteria group bacterium]|nr:hypothetical protein [Patescibacteria group bacterium]